MFTALLTTRRPRQRGLHIFCSLVLLAPLLGACAGVADSVVGTKGGDPAKVELSTGTVNLGAVGASEVLTLSVRNTAGTPITAPRVSWSSDDITVADVAGTGVTGVVTARAPGRTVVRARVGELTLEVAVNVLAVRTITIAPVVASVRAGNSQKFTALLDADRGAVLAVRWSSENPSVGSVNGEGVVTGISPGSTIVRAQSIANPRVMATAQLVVTAARSVAIMKDASTQWVGDRQSLTAVIDVDSTESRALAWSSDNALVASVANDGTMTAVAVGRTVIRASLVADSRARDSLIVSILPARTVSISPGVVALGAGERRVLQAKVTIEAGLSTDVVWRSANPSIAIIAPNGQLTAVAIGTTVISATAVADTTRRATASVSVVPVVRDLDVTPAAVSMFAGDTRQLAASVSADAGLSRAVFWRSGNPTVASVSSTGLVSGVNPGTAIVTAIAEADTTQRVTALITVRAAPIVTVSPGTVTLALGEQRAMTARVEVEAGISTDIRWRSANSSIAMVSASGVVTAIAYGATTVSAISLADSTSQGAAVIVVTPAVQSVAITPATSTIAIGDVRRLAAIVLGDVGVSTAVIWRSSNPSIASISGLGDVTALSVGSTVITALAAGDTTKRASADVVVRNAPMVSVAPTSIVLLLGEQRQLTAMVTADQGLSTAVTWRSSNPAVVAVAAGGQITALSFGSTSVFAISQADTTRRASATVTVQPVVQTVSVSPSSAALFIGQSAQLTSTVNAQGSLPTGVTYRSSNEVVATVSPSGFVTARAAGNATITVLAAADTTKRALSSITVSNRPITVLIAPRSVAVNVGGSTQLTATVLADPGVPTQVTWSSAAPGIAAVSSGGLVVGVAAGTALITATSVADNTKRDTVTVSVGSRLASSWSAARLGGALVEDVVSISGIDASTAFAVNQFGDIFRWSGSDWTLSARGSSFNTQFLAVHGSSLSNIVGVGTGGVIARFNGGSWAGMASGTSSRLNDVFMESASSGFAVGANGTALRWNGSSWSGTTTGSTQALNSVWVSGASAFAVGTNGEVLRFNSGAWTRQSSPTTESLLSVSGQSSTNVVAVGTFGTVLSFNGTAWTLVSSNGITGDLYAVSSVSPSDARMYIAGDDGVLLLNGASLTRVTTPYAPRMFGMSIDATGNVWTSGQRGSVMRLTGSTWSTVSLAPDLIDVWSTSTSNAWAVGEFGFVYRWNGSAWSRQPTPTTGTLNTVWGSSNTDAFAGGDNGTMLRFNGTSWTTTSFPSTASIYAIWGTSATNVYAVTSAGEIVRFNGSSWSTVTTASAALWSIHGSSANDIIATGENGAALRFNGSAWLNVAVNTSGTLAGVWSSGTGATSVGAASSGTSGVAFQFNGSMWSSLATGSSRVLVSIWGPGAADLYATGEQGTLLRFDGINWSTMNSGTTDLLWSVTGAPNGMGGAFAVGYNSTVVTGSGTSGFKTAAMTAPGTGRGTNLNPAAGARIVRGALPSGTARRSRRSKQ